MDMTWDCRLDKNGNFLQASICRRLKTYIQHLSTWRKYLLYLIQDLNTDTRLIEIQQFGIFVRALLCSQPSPTFCAGCRLFRGIGHILWCLSGAELDRNPKNIQLDSSIVSAGSFHVRAISRCRIREVITLSIGLTATDGNMQQHLNIHLFSCAQWRSGRSALWFPYNWVSAKLAIHHLKIHLLPLCF